MPYYLKYTHVICVNAIHLIRELPNCDVASNNSSCWGIDVLISSERDLCESKAHMQFL
jgi:hypothetical protein